MSVIVARFALSELEAKSEPLWWHLKGWQFTRSGYGRRIPTEHMVKLPGGRRWRRVYCCIYSNSGTCYVPDRDGNWTVID